MGFSPKRAKAMMNGKVKYNIYNGDELLASFNHFLQAIQFCDNLQKAEPNNSYVLKLEEA